MKPLIVGPWLGEVGFELLYWIPYLRQALKRTPRERVWVVSRGGCRTWYQDIAANYLELYDACSPAELARVNHRRIAEQAARGKAIGIRRGQQTAKQLDLTQVERDLIAKVSRRAGLIEPDILHPSAMYRLFRPYWRKRASNFFAQWESTTRGKRLEAPTVQSPPDRYVAVKFYASQANPDLPEQRERVAEIVRTLADSVDVVLLHTGTRFDEHGEFHIPDHPRVHRPSFDPRTNLDQQSAVIAGSVGFVGTYGGFAYLAPFLGVPTLACYGLENFRRDHLQLMAAVAAQLLHVSFRAVPIAAAQSLVKRESLVWMGHAA